MGGFVRFLIKGQFVESKSPFYSCGVLPALVVIIQVLSAKSSAEGAPQAGLIGPTMPRTICNDKQVRDFAVYAAQIAAAKHGIVLDAGLIDVTAITTYAAGLDGRVRTDILKAIENSNTECRGGQPSVDNSNQGRCQTALQPLNTAINDFTQGCSTAGLNGDGTSFACMSDAEKCLEPSTYSSFGGDEQSDAAMVNDILAPLQGENASQTFRKVAPTASSARARYEHCAPLASQGLKEWRDDVEKSQKSVEKLQDDLVKLQAELSQLQTTKEVDLQAIQDEAQNLAEETTSKMEALRENLEAKDLEIVEKILAKEAELIKIEQGLFQLSIQKSQAYAEMKKQITDLRLKCQQESLASVAQLRENRITLIQQSQYSAGGFNSLLSGVGLNNVEKGDIMADWFFARCIGDRGFVEQKALADQSYNIAIAAIDQSERDARRMMAFIRQEISRIQIDERNLILTNIKNQITRLERSYSINIDRLERKYQNTSKRFDDQIAEKQNQIALATRRLAERSNFFEQKANYLSAKERFSNNGVDLSPEDVTKVFSGYTKLKNEAHNLVHACDCCNNPQQPGCSPALYVLGGAGADLYSQPLCPEGIPSRSSGGGGGSATSQ